MARRPDTGYLSCATRSANELGAAKFPALASLVEPSGGSTFSLAARGFPCFDSQGAQGLQHNSVRHLRGNSAGPVISRRDFYDVEAYKPDAGDDLAHRAQKFRRRQAAGLWRTRSGRKCGIEHIDIYRQIDCFRPVERFADRLLQYGIEAAFLDLSHQMPAHSLFLHPGKHIWRRPVSSQAYLYEVAAVHCSALYQPPHRRAVTQEEAPVVIRSVGVSVEVDDAYGPAGRLGNCTCRGQCYGVVAAQHHRDCTKPGYFKDFVPYSPVTPLDVTRNDARVSVVEHLQGAQRLYAQAYVVYTTAQIRCRPYCPWSITGTRPVGAAHVERRPDNDGVRGFGGKSFGRRNNGQSQETRYPNERRIRRHTVEDQDILQAESC